MNCVILKGSGENWGERREDRGKHVVNGGEGIEESSRILATDIRVVKQQQQEEEEAVVELPFWLLLSWCCGWHSGSWQYSDCSCGAHNVPHRSPFSKRAQMRSGNNPLVRLRPSDDTLFLRRNVKNTRFSTSIAAGVPTHSIPRAFKEVAASADPSFYCSPTYLQLSTAFSYCAAEH
jgi:hypothetical protein